MVRVIVQFLRQWILCAFWGRKFWTAAIKWGVLGLTSYLATKADEKVMFMVSGQEIWSPSIGTLVTLSLVIAWLSVALGAAWTHFRRSVLRMENNLVGENPYRIRVRNDGLGTSEVGVFVRRVTDADGNDLDNTLPAEARWEHYAARATISPSVPAVASIGQFTFNDATNQHHFIITRLNGGDYEVYGGIAPLGQCWVKVAARDERGAEASAWFLFDLNPGHHHQVAASVPPFEQSSLLRRYWQWLW